MAQVLQPWQILIAALAGWVNRHQQTVIDYVREENRVLKEQLGGRRLRLTDDQRRRLAVKGKAIGRRTLEQVATLVTPDTILAWHRKPVTPKRFLIMDRDRKYCEAFRAMLRSGDIEPVRLPPRSPYLNAYAERFV